MKMQRKITFLLVAIFAETLLVLMVNDSYKSELEDIEQRAVTQLEVKTRSSVNTFNLVSETVFLEAVDRPVVMELYRNATTSDSMVAPQVRDSLYNTLINTYQHLKFIGIRQLHFHLPNNESFLRFHRPQKFGDNLSQVRYSVRMANQTKQVQKGFEEGRIYNGFRYVFPLMYKGVHLGSVETSFSFGAIQQQLQMHGLEHTGFMVRKEIVFNKVFSKEQNNYVPSIISDAYVNELSYLHYKDKQQDTLRLLDAAIRGKVTTQLANNHNFSVYQRIGKQDFVVTFVNLKNLQGHPVAYIVAYQNVPAIGQLIIKAWLVVVFGCLLLALLFVFVYLYLSKAESNLEQNKQLLKSEEMLRQSNSELSKQTQELQEKNHALNELNATKNKFFSILSHDLKNPFHAILGFAELAILYVEKADIESIKRYCELIYSSTKHSYNLLVNLLEWSKIQTERIQFTPQKVQLNSLCMEVYHLLEANLNAKEIRMAIYVQPDLTIVADPFMLQTILRNLISNAIKYTQISGKVTLVASIESEVCKFSVTDNGVGIDQKNLNKIFRLDSTFSTPGTSKEKGSGLGLILCKEFVAMHNGQIWAESTPNQGSAFMFTLPQPSV